MNILVENREVAAEKSHVQRKRRSRRWADDLGASRLVPARPVDATPKQRAAWELIGGGIGIHWEAIDEDISVASLLQPELHAAA